MEPTLKEEAVVLSDVTGSGAVIVKPGISWGAVIAGALVAFGIWMLLHTLGLGIGLTAIDPDDPDSLRGVGIGTGIWSLIEPLVALFIGGLIGSQLAGGLTRSSALIHGGVVWALTTVVAFLGMVAVFSAIAGGVARVAGAAGATAMEQAPTLQSLGLTGDDLVAPVNQRLAAEGKPTVTAAQLEASAQQALRTSVREGRIDRTVLVDSLVANTALDRREADEVAGRIEARWESTTAAAGRTALQAGETTGKVLLGLFGVMLLGLCASCVGALVGGTRFRRKVPRATARPSHPSYDEPALQGR
jgi:hypothetical protein